MSDSGSEKTEEPTGKKLSEAKEKGQMPKSQEINSFAIFFSGIVLLFSFKELMGEEISQLVKGIFNSLDRLEMNRIIFESLMLDLLVTYVTVLSPFFIGLVIIALLTGFAQVGINFSFKTMQPEFSKLDPMKGLKSKIFSSRSLVELLKSLVKLALIGSVLYSILTEIVLESTSLVSLSIIEIVSYLSSSISGMIWKVAIIYALIAGADFAYQKYKYMQDMKMTKQEVKEENKQAEGSPEVKGHIRKQQMMAAKRRMMKELPSADVVVTNPTHYAVALRYKMGQDSAPKVIAKGADNIALKIREVAKEHNIPIHEDPPLARALFRMCDVDDEIPEKLFNTVAKLLATIFRMKNDRSRKIV